jgi:CPA2 family monovalent cation:H+ antiporter-2
MQDAHDFLGFLEVLTLVLCVGAAATYLFRRLHLPVVLGYIIGGLIISPYTPIPVVVHAAQVHTLSETGVILLMFSLGLEFRLRKLVEVGPTAGLTALVQCSAMIWLGIVLGRALGWTGIEGFFAGAIIAISSTTIIAKAFDEQGIRGRLREFVVGVLIVEDLIAIVLMATLTAVASGAGLSAAALGGTAARLAGFLVALIVVGMLIVPRSVRAIVRLRRQEITLVAVVGICFASALLALSLGYSVALGAFIAGTLVAESGHDQHIERLIRPLRDLFAAIFFTSVGMLIDPRLLVEHWVPVVVLTVAVLAGKILGVSVGAFLSGQGVRTSVQAGMSLAQIGEFSFIIAGLGLSLGATGEFLYPVAVAVSAITTLTTPWLIRASGPAASFVDRKLPRPIQTFAALYGSWLEQVRLRRGALSGAAGLRRKVLLLLLDAALLAAVAISAALSSERIARVLEDILGVGPGTARTLVAAGAVLLCLPFAIGILRLARRLGEAVAEKALPGALEGRPDQAAAPRRSLVVALQLLVVLLIAVPLAAITQPFLPGTPSALLLLALLAVLGVAFWRSATNLQGHVRAGAQMIIEVLARQSHEPAESVSMEVAHELLPGLGEPVAVQLHDASRAVGRTLGELDIRSLTGATVLAIRRGDTSVLTPGSKEVLASGDVLVLAGSSEAVELAKGILIAPVVRA